MSKRGRKGKSSRKGSDAIHTENGTIVAMTSSKAEIIGCLVSAALGLTRNAVGDSVPPEAISKIVSDCLRMFEGLDFEKKIEVLDRVVVALRAAMDGDDDKPSQMTPEEVDELWKSHTSEGQ